MPEVSVVIPAYNAERFIAETLRSVQAQTFRDFEVLVVDDGSTDRTASIVDAFGPPIRRLQQKNGGVSRARNAGSAAATGRFVAFLDADDLWDPPKLERQVELLRSRPDVGFCYPGVRRIGADGQVRQVESAREYTDLCRELLLHSSVVTSACSSMMVRRDVLERAGGFDPAFSQCADWDFLIRLSLVTPGAALPKPLVSYRTFAGNMSSDVSHLERDTFAVLAKFFSGPDGRRYAEIQRRCYSNHWMILSGSYLHAGRLGQSLRALAKGLRLEPANVRRPLGLPLRWMARGLGKVFAK
jgi:glycosyltransferase involved in cell wall biosynthesis